MDVSIIGAPLDLGSARRGVDMKPSALRLAGLGERLGEIGLEVEDLGNVIAEIPEIAVVDDDRARYLPAILETCSEVAARVAEAASTGRMRIVLGGCALGNARRDLRA